MADIVQSATATFTIALAPNNSLIRFTQD
jgi:hypothetical protein